MRTVAPCRRASWRRWPRHSCTAGPTGKAGAAQAPTVNGSSRGFAAGPGVEASTSEPDDERTRLIWAMDQSGWVQAKAARILGLTPRQIGYALKKYDIEVKRF